MNCQVYVYTCINTDKLYGYIHVGRYIYTKKSINIRKNAVDISVID